MSTSHGHGLGSNTSTYLLASGRSMATPHAARMVAYLRAVSTEATNASASVITQRIKDPRGSPDLLIDNNSRKRNMLIQA